MQITVSNFVLRLIKLVLLSFRTILRLKSLNNFFLSIRSKLFNLNEFFEKYV